MNARKQKSAQAEIVNGFFIWAFRVAVFFVFAPVAWSYAMAGETFSACLAMACGLGLGPMLTPSD